VSFHYGVKRIKPFRSFSWIGIWQLMNGAIKDHAVILADLPMGTRSGCSYQ